MTIWIDEPYFREQISSLFDELECNDLEISIDKENKRNKITAILPYKEIDLDSYELSTLNSMLGSIRTGNPSLSISSGKISSYLKISLEADKDVFDLEEE